MMYYKILKLIKEDESTVDVIKGLTESVYENPYIIDETLKILGDTSMLYDNISDNNKIALCKMLKRYYSTWYFKFLDKSFESEKLVKASKMDLYKVETLNGVRDATVNEIRNGVRQLITESYYPTSEAIYKKMCLLHWTFTGNLYCYKEAGYKLEYKERECITPFYTQLVNCSNELNELFDWYKSSEYDKALAITNKIIAKKGYKYAEYEKDEIEEDLSVKQVINDILKIFPRGSEDKDYRKALSIALKSSKTLRNTKPIEIAFMRIQYDRYSKDREEYKRKQERTKNNKKDNDNVAEMAEYLIKCRYDGKIDSDDFVFKIINTLKKNKYQCRVSYKQRDIIERAYNKVIDKAEVTEAGNEDKETCTEESKEISLDKKDINSYESISDILDE